MAPREMHVPPVPEKNREKNGNGLDITSRVHRKNEVAGPADESMMPGYRMYGNLLEKHIGKPSAINGQGEQPVTHPDESMEAGYRIAGKTGTSEKIPRGNGKYIASFLAFAPADDPQVACLVILDQPPVGMPYYGGVIAAPVVKNIMEETLQYLGVEPRYKENEKDFVDTEVPDLSGMTAADAEKKLSESGFQIRIKGDRNAVISDQIPKAYTRLVSGSTVVAYTAGTKAERTVVVPKVIGESAAGATSMLTGEGLNARIHGVPGEGGAVCSGQSPEAGSIVEPGTVVTLDFKYQGAND